MAVTLKSNCNFLAYVEITSEDKTMKKPKISVITWNGGFRESFHTVDFFKNQTLPSEEYEFIWVEYYSTAHNSLKDKLETADNARIIFLNQQGQWHVAHCLNEGIRQSLGELLVIVDGDIAVEPQFLEQVWQKHLQYEDLVIYYRRWDEPQRYHIDSISQSSIEHLKSVCQLNNPENYGGCITIRRHVIERAGGYEEHPVIGGPGVVSKELYTRLRNLGLPIMWHPTGKIYHPWHAGTLPPATPQQHRQAWVLRCRSLNLDTMANFQQVDAYLKDYPVEQYEKTTSNNVNLQSSSFLHTAKTFVKQIPGLTYLARLVRKMT